jgi:hypothetical protein
MTFVPFVPGARVYIQGEGWGPQLDQPYLLEESESTGSCPYGHVSVASGVGTRYVPVGALTGSFKNFKEGDRVRFADPNHPHRGWSFRIDSIREGMLYLQEPDGRLLTSGVSRRHYEPAERKVARWEFDGSVWAYRLDPPHTPSHGSAIRSFMSAATCRENGYTILSGPTKEVLEETDTKMLCGKLSVRFDPDTKELTFNEGIGTKIPIELCVAIANKWGAL